MNTLKTISIPFLFLLNVIFVCCSGPKQEPKEPVKTYDDSIQAIHTFLYGLWSEDSGNVLANTGFFFRNDGTVDLIASEYTGKWKINGKDSLQIDFDTWSGTKISLFRIDSL